MIVGDTLSRRKMFAKLGMLFNGAVGAVLAVPILRYILSPLIRADQKPGFTSET